MRSGSWSITAVNRKDNDGEIAALAVPKPWQPNDVSSMLAGGGSVRPITSVAWSTNNVTPADDWVNHANVGSYLYLFGDGLEKDTRLRLFFRGTLQLRGVR